MISISHNIVNHECITQFSKANPSTTLESLSKTTATGGITPLPRRQLSPWPKPLLRLHCSSIRQASFHLPVSRKPQLKAPKTVLRLGGNTKTLQRIEHSLASPDFVLADCCVRRAAVRHVECGTRARGMFFSLAEFRLIFWGIEEIREKLLVVDGVVEHLGVVLVV